MFSPLRFAGFVFVLSLPAGLLCLLALFADIPCLQACLVCMLTLFSCLLCLQAYFVCRLALFVWLLRKRNTNFKFLLRFAQVFLHWINLQGKRADFLNRQQLYLLQKVHCCAIFLQHFARTITLKIQCKEYVYVRNMWVYLRERKRYANAKGNV